MYIYIYWYGYGYGYWYWDWYGYLRIPMDTFGYVSHLWTAKLSSCQLWSTLSKASRCQTSSGLFSILKAHGHGAARAGGGLRRWWCFEKPRDVEAWPTERGNHQKIVGDPPVLQHGLLENGPSIIRWKPLVTSGIFQPAMVDETRGHLGENWGVHQRNW